jgi:hypothetical protein
LDFSIISVTVTPVMVIITEIFGKKIKKVSFSYFFIDRIFYVSYTYIKDEFRLGNRRTER